MTGIAFDDINRIVAKVLQAHAADLPTSLLINRDLTGRVRLVVPARARDEADTERTIEEIANELSRKLAPHSYPADRMILWEPDINAALDGIRPYPLPSEGNLPGVRVIDRLVNGSSWSSITEPEPGAAPRIVFFSIKGGVGRSTALAATAWHLARSGKRVLVVDLDLESPGLSSELLPEDRRSAAGIVDWLVEDLVDNGDAVLPDLYAVSPISREDDIYVLPAHGAKPGEYVSKLGRAWMAKVSDNGDREPWERRLARLLRKVEGLLHPDVVLLDCRSGLDEVASNTISALGAGLVLLFATDSAQTRSGYRILFDHWQRTDAVHDIRKRLQLVAALVPEVDPRAYVDRLRDDAETLFAQTLYDQIPRGAVGEDDFSFALDDPDAPHHPWNVRWNAGIDSLRSLSDVFGRFDAGQLDLVFGGLFRGVDGFLGPGGEGGDEHDTP